MSWYLIVLIVLVYLIGALLTIIYSTYKEKFEYILASIAWPIAIPILLFLEFGVFIGEKLKNRSDK
jgi:uncharacterized membrane protein YhaH (DUF805 family)